MSMKAFVVGGVVACGLLVAGARVSAHHSFAAEFDADKKISLTGIVTKVEWTNPHVWFYINVKDEKTGRSDELGRRDGAAARPAAPRLASEHAQDRRLGHR